MNPALETNRTYTYAGTSYANPHAVTQLSNGLSTSTYSYDQNGNLTQKTTDGITTTYLWDYANRLTALGVNNATTSYGYDAFGSRVLQTAATTTNIYPFKWYSVASSTGSGASYATTTSYVFNGDSLVATVDQQTAAGVATGTPQTRYIHPDHLGSTNVVTNASGTVVQTLDYFPYGGLRIDTGTNVSDRKFIGERYDQTTDLNYFNARYYQSSRGQFLSQDPVFRGLGVDKRTAVALLDPQQLNSYNYARNNPITNKDSNGEQAVNLGLSYATYVPGSPTPAGPMGGVILAFDGIYYYSGTTFSVRPGPGLSLTGALGNPAEGYTSSVSAFGAYGIFGGQAGIQERPGGGYQFSDPEVGIGLPGASWDTYKVKKLVDFGDLFGAGSQIQYVSTPATINSSFLNSNPSSPTRNSSYYVSQYNNFVAQGGKRDPSTPAGSYPAYTAQTYTTPNGAQVDWYGTVVSPAPSKKYQNSIIHT
jgi:RHS repeat-associated protein